MLTGRRVHEPHSAPKGSEPLTGTTAQANLRVVLLDERSQTHRGGYCMGSLSHLHKTPGKAK